MYNPPETNGFPSAMSDEREWNWDPSPTIRLLACLLIVFGLLLMAYVLREIYLAYPEPTAHPFVLDIKQALADQALFSEGGAPAYIIGEGGATIIALVISLLFAALMVSIAAQLIRSGAHVLSPRFSTALHYLRRRVNLLLQRT